MAELKQVGLIFVFPGGESLNLTRFDGNPRSGGCVRLGWMYIMEDTGKKPRRPRRAFTPELKAKMVEVCRRGDWSTVQVARDFDLTGNGTGSASG